MTAAFPALGFDPAPGDPGAVSLLSREARRVTTQVGSLGDDLRQLGEVHALWQGTAAQEFVQLFTQLPDSLRATEKAFSILAERLCGWEVTLLELQAAARALEVEAQAVMDRRASRWHTSSARDAVPVPPIRFGPIGAPTGPDDAQIAQARAHVAALQLQAECAAILARAHKLQQRAEKEGDKVAAAVRTATAFAPPPPGIFEQLGDWFSEVDRAVGNFVNNHIDDIAALADAASALGLLVMLIPGVGLAPGLLLGGLALAASSALARYADGSKTDVALAVGGVGVGGVAARAGRLAAKARADETGTAVQPLASMWTATGGGAREEGWGRVQMAANLSALTLNSHGVAALVTRRLGRQPASPDDPKPRLQLVLPAAPAPAVPTRGGPSSGAPATPVAGTPEAGRRAEPRHLWPATRNDAPGNGAVPAGGPTRRPAPVGGP